MRKRTKRRVRYRPDGGRGAEYSQKTTGYLPNASRLGAYKASPGDFLLFRYTLDDGSLSEPHYGRMLGMVESTGHDGLEAIKGHLAVLEIAMEFRGCWMRWVAPEQVTFVSNGVPQKLLAWFLGIGNDDPVKNGDLETILRLADRGSLSENYIDSVEYCPECQGLLTLGTGSCVSEGCSIAQGQREKREREHADWKAENELRREARKLEASHGDV